jgi:hypothetical protein
METDTVAAPGRVEHQAMLAPASGHGRFVVVLTSSVAGRLLEDEPFSDKF